MEITLDRLKIIIGDQQCQIVTLQTEKNQLVVAYNKLNEANKLLESQLKKKPTKKTGK